ncbi:mCG144680, partial [Mus musculus]
DSCSECLYTSLLSSDLFIFLDIMLSFMRTQIKITDGWAALISTSHPFPFELGHCHVPNLWRFCIYPFQEPSAPSLWFGLLDVA